ncbi:PIN domain-containing protein [Candidatus Woesearchaeota archaeon]|nr:PIN domain-containing protein [Candidatus Woesearchaeota archaeon]
MVCLDTSFLIDVLRGEKRVEEIENRLDKGTEPVKVASPAIMELIRGAVLSNNPETEKQKVHQLLSYLIVLNLDKESAIIAGNIEAELIKAGEKIDVEDIMIGAIAKKDNETLLTRNKKHFEKIKGLKIESY